MKRHFSTLFDATHIKKTIYLFIISASLIITSSLVGISDNLPMIAMLLAGIMLLFFTVLHPWKKAINYAIMAMVCFGILLLEVLVIFILDKIDKTEYISEGIGMSIAFLVCVPGILVGINGAIFCALRKK
ncbi:MAG: hypothetical protein GX660_28975 [Clostridiaceae bacterium]|jgi:hypothetical protein|nr:hypothetical protein [Clostridiaceae bacterium]